MFRFILLMMMSSMAWAQSSSLNLNLPSTPGSYASDRIRTSENVECSMAIGGSVNVEFGVVGVINQNGPFYNNQGLYPEGYDPDGIVKDVGVYAKITIPLNAPKKRLDCNRLYLLELERTRMEIQKLKAEMTQLRTLKFEGEE
jgi:hypothetical protein